MKHKPKSGTTPHEAIVKFFRAKFGSKYSFKQIKKQLSAKFPVDVLYATVKDLEEEKILVSRGTHYKLVAEDKRENRQLVSVNTIEGEIEMTQSGNAFLIKSSLPEDLRIHESNLGSALDGDWVQVKILPQYKRKRLEGKVVEVLKRNTDIFTGNIQITDKFAFVKPDKQNMPVDIFVPF